MGELIIHHM